MPDKSLIQPDIDLAADGRRAGYLQLPHSVHDSAYGRILIPIVVVKNGAGPTVLLTGGVHGDEYEGPIALFRLVAELQADDVRGRIVVVPSLNYPAFEAGLRTSPVDGLNLNRTFPGDRNGSVTEMIAHYVASELHPIADVHLDFHAGGSSLQYLPLLLAPYPEVGADAERLQGIVEAFGAERIVAFDGRRALSADDRVIANSAFANRCLFLTGEFGGGSTVNRQGLALVERGVRNVLAHLGVVPGAPRTDGPPPVRLTMGDPGLFAYAPVAGVFEPAFSLGEVLEPGALAGRVYDPVRPWLAPEEVRFSAGGLAVCIRTFARVRPGDCLGHLARFVEA